VGLDLLRGPVDPANGFAPGFASFTRYTNGTDPTNAQETHNYMKGLNRDGSLLIDPTTSLVTTFAVPGDPVAGTGWLDSNPGDRRFMVSSGPFSMPPDDVQTIVAAIVIGQGSDRLSSITALRHDDDMLQAAYACDFPYPRAPGVECPGNLAWQPGNVQNVDYTIANPGCEPEVFDYSLSSARDWPGFPITGSIQIEGEGSAIVTIPVPVPDTVAGAVNVLELQAHLQDADLLADQCQHRLVDPAVIGVDGPAALERSLGRVSPNPAPGELTVSFSLPDAAPARIELLDLAGRRVASRRVDALGPGRHRIRLSESARLPAGTYVVRLTQGGRSLATKVSLIR
jgi:hypothetical protein